LTGSECLLDAAASGRRLEGERRYGTGMASEAVAPSWVTAGYVVASATRRPAEFDPGVPDPFLTISWCLADGLVVPEYSGWFQSREEAEDAVRRGPAGSLLIAVGMTPQDGQDLVRGMSEEPSHFRLLTSGRALPSEAAFVGFEIVGAESGLNLHSWHCHGYAPEAQRDLGVQLTGDGLLRTYEEAVRVRQWMLAMPPDEQPAPVPWAIVRLGIVPI
jgi:hypothetical protein